MIPIIKPACYNTVHMEPVAVMAMTFANSSIEHIVVLTGAGVSAESGLGTFRDNGGLWEQHSVYDVATPEAFVRDPDLVQRFYNARRRQLADVEPNFAHRALAQLEQTYKVSIITQNIDDLHERAGSTQVLHLHGELTKARSTVDPELIYDIGYAPITPEERCVLGSPLRPHVVWFGELVPMIESAMMLASQADYLLVIGTSLQVYPAASLVNYVAPSVPITVIDPGEPAQVQGAQVIRKTACEGMQEWLAGLAQ